MKRLIALFVLVFLTLTLNASAVPLPGYEFRTVVGAPCGGDIPTDLCTSLGNPIALTKLLLATYSAQGWQLLSTTPVLYGAGNQGVVFLLGRNPALTIPVKLQQFEIVMGMSCGQDPNGLPSSRLCTANGTPVEKILNSHTSLGWNLVSTTSCTYRYDQGEVGMAVYLLSK